VIQSDQIPTEIAPGNAWKLCVAPMMDWTDTHCRVFHRLLSPHARLYTEMVTTGALLHGDAARHLEFDPAEHPVALQIGGSEADDLARCAKMGQARGYDEINLNCGCPSERVQRGAFGACLMAEPGLVADCVRAMQDAVSIPITVKHRIGIDRADRYEFVRDFVGRLYDAGVRVFIAHARNAWLKGLSPKENREIPPLRYEFVRRLKRDFPEATVLLNGGLTAVEQVRRELDGVDGVMLGRVAYHEPWMLARIDRELFGPPGPGSRRSPSQPADVIEPMSRYLERVFERGVAPRSVVRHMLGLYHGSRGARQWRRLLSDPRFLEREGAGCLRAAARAVGMLEGRLQPA
jgi:tRNA-dihydrouridine synthase A